MDRSTELSSAEPDLCLVHPDAKYHTRILEP